MMDRKKKTGWILFLAIAAGALLLMALLLFQGSRERKIARFVLDNQEELLKISLDCLHGQPAAERYQDVFVEGCYEGEGWIVQFYAGGSGLVPSSRYYGFYYSPEDQPAAFQNVQVPLTSDGQGEWTWSDGTDNGGRTKRIAPHWFYYEAWF